MTGQRLRDLLDERVLDLGPADLAGAAWDGARRIRRRRAALGAGAATAAVLVAALLVRPGDGRGPGDPTAPPSSSASATTARTTVERGGDYRGVPTWWAPPAAGEPDLPLQEDTPLPASIDLAPGAPAHRTGVAAVAVYEVAGDDPSPGRVVVVGVDGTSSSLDVARLDAVTDQEGNAIRPLTAEGLSPDGRRVFFVQEGSLEVYDLMTGAWASFETVRWSAEGARWTSAVEIWAPGEAGALTGTGTTYDVTGAGAGTGTGASEPSRPTVWDGAGEPFGPVEESGAGGVAQAEFLAEAASPPDGAAQGGLDAVAARTGGDDVHLLVMPGQGGRWKGCCPVAGWLDDRTVVLESRSESFRVLAWRVGTPDLRQVSRVVGWTPGDEVPVGSFADLR